MYFRVTRAGKYAYLQIAQSYRDSGQVKQRIIATLGRLDVLQATGQLDRLIQSGARFTQRVAVIDAHAAGRTEAVRVRRIGADLVFRRLWEETGIQRVLKGLLEERRYEFDVDAGFHDFRRRAAIGSAAWRQI